MEEHRHPLHLGKSALPPDTRCRDTLEPEAELGKDPRLDPPLGADETHPLGRVPGQKLLGYGYSGEQMAAGAAAGNDEPHGIPLTRDDTLRSIPTANRVMI